MIDIVPPTKAFDPLVELAYQDSTAKPLLLLSEVLSLQL